MSKEIWLLRFDGGARGNPGSSGCGFVLYNNGEIASQGHKSLGHGTNGRAEYSGLILGLEYIKERGIKSIQIEGDSQLVILQLSGAYKVNEVMRPYHQEAKLLLEGVKYTLRYIPRNENKDADRLSNMAMDLN
jgi:ribonuclease HI